MAEVNWVKLQTDMYDHPKLKIIDSMEDRDLIHYIWTSSILLAGRANKDGELYLNDEIAYTLKTLAITFRRTLEEVKKAYKVLKKLGMIEVTEEKVFRIKNWNKYQNVDGLERIRKQTNDRVKKYREKKREEKKNADNNLEEDNQYNNSSSEDDNVHDNKESYEPELNNDENIEDNEINNKSVTCNVTDDENCVTETQEIKNKNYKKNKKKEKVEKEKSLSQSNISSDVIELSEYCERISGIVSVLEIGALNLAIEMHGKDNVKKAIDKAIEVGKVNMPYISGILKNWRKEGYPKEDEIRGNDYGGKYNNKGNEPDTVKLKDFKPKEPRRLSAEERKKASASVV